MRLDEPLPAMPLRTDSRIALKEISKEILQTKTKIYLGSSGMKGRAKAMANTWVKSSGELSHLRLVRINGTIEIVT